MDEPFIQSNNDSLVSVPPSGAVTGSSSESSVPLPVASAISGHAGSAGS